MRILVTSGLPVWGLRGWLRRRSQIFQFVPILAVFTTGALVAGAADVANYQQLRRFDGTPTDGEYFYDGVTEGSDGKLYGAMVNGGPQDGGVVFRMNKDGTGYELLHIF